MRKTLIGILNYGAGNFTSVRTCITHLGYRSRLITTEDGFTDIDLLLIPGVGAFPSAMELLNKLQLTQPIRAYAMSGKPVLGICLGMQLLAERSYELGVTRGLELLPGDVKPLSDPDWHIGWNTLEAASNDDFAQLSDGNSVYFNHSFEFKAPEEYIISLTRAPSPITAIVRKGNICGVQFHPEKSQTEGARLLHQIMQELFSDA